MSKSKSLKCKSCDNIIDNVGLNVTAVTCSTCVSSQLLDIETIELEKDESLQQE